MSNKEIKKETPNKNPFATLLSILPEKPGCYQYFDEKGKIIYVGKAKNLKKRVSSYFTKMHDNLKTHVLVKQIRDIKYIVVDTEEDALHLENSLIKQYRPRYNVMLKDDKSYPSIIVKNEYFPRVFQTRNIVRDGSQYYGPYSSIYIAKVMLQMLKDIYPIRTCKYPLTPENIAQKKFKVCLQYHIKRCKGPCEGLQSLEEYQNNIVQIKEILKGNISKISRTLFEEMQKYAAELKFEEAQSIKEKYEAIENYRAKSTVVPPMLTNIDVFSFTENEQSAYINYMHIGNGAIVQAYTFEYKKKLDEPKEELLGLGIVEMRSRFKSTAKEIIIPFIPDIELSGNITFHIPQKGDKKKLLELSEQNVKQYKIDKLKQAEKLNPEQRTTRILTTMQKELHTKELPIHIECFDNSNIQGTNPVAACVVFKKAKPSKKDYRHFHIKTVEGPNDFASMIEVVGRRYSRLLEEKEPLPQLIIIDGGKGQLSAATEVIKNLGLLERITIVGLAKRLEEIFFPNDPIPLILDKNSETLRVIQQLRDEAHRFGITFHRQLRSKKQTASELDQIKGIGEKTKTLLLRKFKSVKRIKEASEEELTEIIGKAKTAILLKEFNK
ncbi:excinuclease ABC subunit C [Parabacteroides sp. PF5-5]|uniref:excinuclease ABC subunit UvrC n=1 Tax=unclassified Parabacteroides TaxID=2649774 RepID=UPI002473A83E|nr:MULTISPECIES: excinuclease ABC subunit UvrC [unclassified Parabacteroides]MDH6305986.1 excinuclease ABC subunit C [Parabacteroides sp. PH5-39]MDH6317242.1 excinuclease ABC subunit C [Parabacteroides sp. PF5-13]MDH6320698.1 excinuclease ABC subunit C [Parabacteroides sp. PH5-13]MDH6324381.1 excinuclease ABC subunit C [Parabacteroides sp. PH5-8]MDH6328427.1 excinuclease ABC subunit C [Parabacteroides sp. PH5-41]